MIADSPKIVSRAILFSAALLLSAAIGTVAGLGFAFAHNFSRTFNFTVFREGENSKVLDVKGREITTFFADERRENIKITDVPHHLRDALVIREDQEFFSHQGFSLRGTLRAIFQILTGRLFSGGSTITQQIAGNLYSNRREITLQRKLVELWWAFLLERAYSKNEILELYLNKMPFGHGTYGVEAASQFYFKKSARDISVAESVLLAIQLVKPGLYSPIRNPNRARSIQREILKQMVEFGVVNAEEAERSFVAYWDNYDYLRDDRAVFFEREDRAPYFSEYVRNILNEQYLGAVDIYRNQYLIYTTLDLDMQAAAEEAMKRWIEEANRRFRENKGSRLDVVDREFIPLLDFLSVVFDIPNLRVSGRREIRTAMAYMERQINPLIDILASTFGIEDMIRIARINADNEKRFMERNQVEGALIALENETGHIRAMVGGAQFNRANQFNRAIQARVQPGSAFKPFLYAAAIDSKLMTAATRFFDGPIAFELSDEEVYAPMNYGGVWYGNVLMRKAIAISLNVPAILTLHQLGFDRAIAYASRLLGITDPQEIRRNFPREYPLALGVSSVSPLQMARGYAVFASGGREVRPLAIRYIQDSYGNIIANPASEQEAELRRRGQEAQIISPQTAYIMTSLLQSSLEYGTLQPSTSRVGGFDGMDMAGKTGTPQNWSDSWAIGYSPYLTTAVWIGFDRLGNSLGMNNVGIAAHAWADFMKEVHRSLPLAKFKRPEGLVQVAVSATTGGLPVDGERTIMEWFIRGTEPKSVSPLTYQLGRQRENLRDNLLENLSVDMASLGTDPLLNLNLNLELNFGGTSAVSPPSSPATPPLGDLQPVMEQN